jgi:tRNA U34 5-methylaminomethyl-2-thiouridine-forming methyltransferase MnmC
LDAYPETDSTHRVIPITEWVQLELIKTRIQDFEMQKKFDLIFYDAFAPSTQPEMWTQETIEKTCQFLKPGGIFITYSITGNLKRIFRSLNFEIGRPKGAAGKREMFRAIKLS